MPLYTAIVQDGVLTSDIKNKFAKDVTDFHTEYAGVPREFVHIVFQTYAPGDGFTAGVRAATAALTVVIRKGRSVDYKHGLLRKLWSLLQDATGAPDDQLALAIHEVPASQAMEMGQIMPDFQATNSTS